MATLARWSLAAAVPVEFAEQGRTQDPKGQPARLDQQLDRVGTVIGQADLAPQPPLLGIGLGLDRVLGVPEQPQQQVLGADILAMRDRLLVGEVDEESYAHKRRRDPHRPVGGGLGGSVAHPLGRPPVGLTTEALLQAPGHRLQVDAEAGQQRGVAEVWAWEHALGDQPLDLGRGPRG